MSGGAGVAERLSWKAHSIPQRSRLPGDSEAWLVTEQTRCPSSYLSKGWLCRKREMKTTPSSTEPHLLLSRTHPRPCPCNQNLKGTQPSTPAGHAQVFQGLVWALILKSLQECGTVWGLLFC